MPLLSQNGLKYFQFNSFHQNEVIHGIFSRLGGVSPEPWDSLNVGGTVGDDCARVAENRKRMFSVLTKEVESAFDVWQVHSADIVCADRPRHSDEDHIKADGILTNSKNVTLFMRFADCVPIFLYDPGKQVVGIVHAGWQGTVKKVAAAAIKKMVTSYGTNPSDVFAGIGPSICSKCYEIQDDVIRIVANDLGEFAQNELLHSQDGKNFFDMWKANSLILQSVGVEKIEVSGICTACNHTVWFSHRADHGKTGRLGAIISLK